MIRPAEAVKAYWGAGNQIWDVDNSICACILLGWIDLTTMICMNEWTGR